MGNIIYQFVAIINLFAYLYSFYILFPLLGGQSIDSGMQSLAIFVIITPVLIFTSGIYWILGIRYKIKTFSKNIPLVTALLLCTLLYIDQSSELINATTTE